MFGERRWVKDDEVVGVLRSFQELEGVFGETLMTRVVGEVEVHVSLREFNGFGGSIDAVNECCSASECIDAETAGVAEHVENMTSLGIVFQKFTVFTLVHEEACLLSRQPIDLEAESLFCGNLLVVFADEEAVLLPHLCFEGESGFGFIIYVPDSSFADFDECLGNLLSFDVHSDGVSLKHGGVAIDIHHESRQSVAFSVNESEDVVAFFHQSEGATKLKCLAQTLFPKGGIYFLVFKGQHPDGNGTNLTVTVAEQFPF